VQAPQALECGSLLPLLRRLPAAGGAEQNAPEVLRPRRTQQAATATKRQQAAAVQGACGAAATTYFPATQRTAFTRIF
jgi:hypothetical protein